MLLLQLFWQSKRNKHVLNKIEGTTFAYIDLFYFPSFIFKKIFFTEKSNPSEKNVIVEEELDCIGTDHWKFRGLT